MLVHGAGGGGWEWNTWRGVLEAHGFACNCVELEASPTGLAATTFDDYRARVLSALAVLPRPRVLIGASLGGLLAATCASSAEALVLVNPLPPAPWASQLLRREWPGVVPWHRDARLASTRRALPDADDATALFAFRRWRDESGAVLRQAHDGIEVAVPECPVLCVASELDEDVPAGLTVALAQAWGASVLHLPGSTHVGPLLARDSADVAGQVVAWLARAGCR